MSTCRGLPCCCHWWQMVFLPCLWCCSSIILLRLCVVLMPTDRALHANLQCFALWSGVWVHCGDWTSSCRFICIVDGVSSSFRLSSCDLWLSFELVGWIHFLRPGYLLSWLAWCRLRWC
jgi:hypothetical protein